MTAEQREYLARKNLARQSGDYRAFVGPSENYDVFGAMQFCLLTRLGLREHHFLLDIGCGSLRAGRLFITYLRLGRYFGMEPEPWLIEQGIRNELGDDMIRIECPNFSNDVDFTLSALGRKFDYILAHSIFSHASQQQIKRCLSEAKKVMMPSSVFAATFVQGQENYTGREWVHCATYTLDYFVGLAEEQGLTCTPIAWPHPDPQTWAVITNPESKTDILDVFDVTRLSHVETELRLYKQRLERIQSHPYVRLGLTIRRLMKRIQPYTR